MVNITKNILKWKVFLYDLIKKELIWIIDFERHIKLTGLKL